MEALEIKTSLVLALVYLVAALLIRLWRRRKSGDFIEKMSPFWVFREWIPPRYSDEFKGCRKLENIFTKDKEEPDIGILILGRFFSTHSRAMLLVDDLVNLLTGGLLRFDEIFRVGKPLSLRLYFKNISENKVPVKGGETKFFIYYPEDKELLIKYPGKYEGSRQWSMKIPSLQWNESCFVDQTRFFTPEVPGDHELRIKGIKGLVLAGPHGVCDRKYRIPEEKAGWRLTFHVSTGYEYKIFIIVFCTLLIAIFTLLVTIIAKVL